MCLALFKYKGEIVKIIGYNCKNRASNFIVFVPFSILRLTCALSQSNFAVTSSSKFSLDNLWTPRSVSRHIFVEWGGSDFETSGVR